MSETWRNCFYANVANFFEFMKAHLAQNVNQLLAAGVLYRGRPSGILLRSGRTRAGRVIHASQGHGSSMVRHTSIVLVMGATHCVK